MKSIRSTSAATIALSMAAGMFGNDVVTLGRAKSQKLARGNGQRNPAGSKLARMAREGRIGGRSA